MRTPLIIATLFLMGCENPNNPCNAGGPQSFTLGLYDHGWTTFTALQDGDTLFVEQVSAGSGQGGGGISGPGAVLYWLVTGVKTRQSGLDFGIDIDNAGNQYLWGEGGDHNCHEDLGSLGSMALMFPTDKADVDLIGLDIHITVNASYGDVHLTDTFEGTLDLNF